MLKHYVLQITQDNKKIQDNIMIQFVNAYVSQNKNTWNEKSILEWFTDAWNSFAFYVDIIAVISLDHFGTCN